MNRRWIYKTIPDQQKIDSLSESININQHLSAILLQRGINSFQEARKFFRPSLEDLHDPFLMKDMAVAVERLKVAIDREEKLDALKKTSRRTSK